MSLLSADSISQIDSALKGGPAPSAPAPQSAPPSTPSVDVKPETPAAPEETSQSESASAQPDASSSTTSAKQSNGQKVPYGRFKNVLEARNRFKNQASKYQSDLKSQTAKIEDLQKQLAELQSRPAPVQTAAPQTKEESTDSWLDDLLGTGEESESKAAQDAEAQKWQQQYQERFQSMNDRMYQYEVKQAQRELESEIRSITGRYPELNPRDLAQLVVNDPTINLAEAAETFMTYRAAIEEQAIARYLKENPRATVQEAAVATQAEPAAVAPPRPDSSRSSVGSGPVASSGASSKPRNLKDARDALKEYFASGRSPFTR
jgi:hypothetical protein